MPVGSGQIIRRCAALGTAFLATLLLAPAAGAVINGGVYVIYLNSNYISQFTIGAGGLLAPVDHAAAPGDQGGISGAATPDGRSVYTAHQRGGVPLRQWDVNPETGALTPKAASPTVEVPGTPESIAVAPNGRDAYVTTKSGGYTGFGGIAQYDIDPFTGALTYKDPPTVAAPDHYKSIVVSPDGTHVYATRLTDEADYAETIISQFDVDPATGRLSSEPRDIVPPSPVYDIAIAPDGRSLYASHAPDGGIFQYAIDRHDGTLTPKHPLSVPGADGMERLAVSRAGHLYSTFRKGSDQGIAQFDIDPATDALTSMVPAFVPLDGPGPFVVAPDGKSLYVLTNAEGGQVAQFDVDPATGALAPKTPATQQVNNTAQALVATPKPTGSPTRTYVVCDPTYLVARVSTSCTGAVVGPDGWGTPTGTVTLTTDGAGAFLGGGTCTLAGVTATISACSDRLLRLPRRRLAQGCITDTITATYHPRGPYKPSTATFALRVCPKPWWWEAAWG